MSNWACRKCKVKLELSKIYVVETPRFLDVELCGTCSKELRKIINPWLTKSNNSTKEGESDETTL